VHAECARLPAGTHRGSVPPIPARVPRDFRRREGRGRARAAGRRAKGTAASDGASGPPAPRTGSVAKNRASAFWPNHDPPRGGRFRLLLLTKGPDSGLCSPPSRLLSAILALARGQQRRFRWVDSTAATPRRCAAAARKRRRRRAKRVAPRKPAPSARAAEASRRGARARRPAAVPAPRDSGAASSNCGAWSSARRRCSGRGPSLMLPPDTNDLGRVLRRLVELAARSANRLGREMRVAQLGT